MQCNNCGDLSRADAAMFNAISNVGCTCSRVCSTRFVGFEQLRPGIRKCLLCSVTMMLSGDNEHSTFDVDSIFGRIKKL